jgi:3-oxoacyl-[acyl-carrier-protein] synthase III
VIRARIIGTGSYLPKKVLTNHDLEKRVETTDQWILERTGIQERRIASDTEAASDLAVVAAQNSLEMAQVNPSDIDLIIVATGTPDMLFPSTACLVQDRIGARRAFAFDLSAACSGFLYALSVGDQYIHSGSARTVLIIGSEVMSMLMDWKDRSTCILFGDGAGAAVLRAAESDRGVLSTHLHSDGSLWDLICVPGGGSKNPPSKEMLENRLNYLKMKGNETFKVAVRTLEEAAREALDANHYTAKDLDLVIPHQANLRILQSVAQRLDIPIEKVVLNLQSYGNTSAASIPIALDEAVRAGRVKEGHLILMEAFGGGLTWGSALVRW